MQKKVKSLATSLPLLAAVLLGSGSIYGIVNADAVTGTANVTYTPGDTPIPGGSWDIVIPTSYDFTGGNNPAAGAKPGAAVQGVVQLTDPYGNTYLGDKTVVVTAKSANNGVLKDDKGNGNGTYQLQDDQAKVLKDDGSAPVATLSKEKRSSRVDAAITKAERSKGNYSDVLTFSAQESQPTPAPPQP